MLSVQIWGACALALFTGAEPSSTLSVVSAFEYPKQLYRVILRNDGNAAVDFSDPRIFDRAEQALQLLWAIAEPRNVPRGGSVFVTYRLNDQFELARNGSNIPHTLKMNGIEVSYDVAGQPAVTATYLVYNPADGQAYLYLRNLITSDCSVAKVTIAGTAMELGGPVTLPAATTNLATGAWTPPEPNEYAVPLVAVELQSPELGSVTVPARLFNPSHTPTIERSELPLFIACLSHKFSNLTEAGIRAVEHANLEIGHVRTIKFCNVDLSGHAPANFAAIAERCRIELQTTCEDECKNGVYIPAVFRIAREIKDNVEPGIFVTILYGEFIHQEEKSFFGLSVIRNVAYTCLAAGSKGFVLEPLTPADLPPEFQNGLNTLIEELDRLQPLVALSEPVDWVKADDHAWCIPHLLMCGKEGLLLIALPHQPAIANTAQLAGTLCITPPAANVALSAQAHEIGGLHERVSIAPVDSHYEIQVSPSEDARVFLIQFQSRNP